MTDPVATAREFVARINRHDVPALARLMTADHRLVDAGGVVVTGPERARAAWRAYFRMVPDYEVVVQRVLADGDTVVLLGHAGGTFVPETPRGRTGTWQTPAAWRAVIRDGAVAVWQVYADNEPLRALMRAHSPEADGPA